MKNGKAQLLRLGFPENVRSCGVSLPLCFCLSLNVYACMQIYITHTYVYIYTHIPVHIYIHVPVYDNLCLYLNLNLYLNFFCLFLSLPIGLSNQRIYLCHGGSLPLQVLSTKVPPTWAAPSTCSRCRAWET